MSTTAASGSGEPPAGRDYGADKNLPRSGLLEQGVGGERRYASRAGARSTGTRSLCCWRHRLQALEGVSPKNCLMAAGEVNLQCAFRRSLYAAPSPSSRVDS